MHLEAMTYKTLEEALFHIAGEGVSIRRKTAVYGGDINQAWHLILSDGSNLFMKTNSIKNQAFFSAEAAGLSALRALKCIGVPEVYALGTDQQAGISFLIMEYLHSAKKNADYWEVFGAELAVMHRQPGPENYGFFQDNYIGANPQKNSCRESWIAFYRDCRLLPQIEMAKSYLQKDVMVKIDRILDHLDRYLREPASPAILHGDLWSGNAMPGNDGKAWLIDPAVYYGDWETDLAMTQLFGSFPAVFYQSYHSVNPIDIGYRDRKPLYHLYHMLNHLNLFGTGYLAEVIDIIDRYY